MTGQLLRVLNSWKTSFGKSVGEKIGDKVASKLKVDDIFNTTPTGNQKIVTNKNLRGRDKFIEWEDLETGNTGMIKNPSNKKIFDYTSESSVMTDDNIKDLAEEMSKAMGKRIGGNLARTIFRKFVKTGEVPSINVKPKVPTSKKYGGIVKRKSGKMVGKPKGWGKARWSSK